MYVVLILYVKILIRSLCLVSEFFIFIVTLTITRENKEQAPKTYLRRTQDVTAPVRDDMLGMGLGGRVPRRRLSYVHTWYQVRHFYNKGCCDSRHILKTWGDHTTPDTQTDLQLNNTSPWAPEEWTEGVPVLKRGNQVKRSFCSESVEPTNPSKKTGVRLLSLSPLSDPRPRSVSVPGLLAHWPSRRQSHTLWEERKNTGASQTHPTVQKETLSRTHTKNVPSNQSSDYSRRRHDFPGTGTSRSPDPIFGNRSDGIRRFTLYLSQDVLPGDREYWACRCHTGIHHVIHIHFSQISIVQEVCGFSSFFKNNNNNKTSPGRVTTKIFLFHYHR